VKIFSAMQQGSSAHIFFSASVWLIWEKRHMRTVKRCYLLCLDHCVALAPVLLPRKKIRPLPIIVAPVTP